MLKALGIAVALSVLPWPAVAAEAPVQPSPSVVRVVAEASLRLKPDQAELALGVTTDKKTAAAAVAENERKMQQVLAVLKKEVGADGEVKTSELTVRPRFEETRNGQVAHILGYTVTNVVEVRVANIKSVGRLLDLAFQAGANTAERVGFTLKDSEAAQNAALRAASAKARARATAIAEGQGLRVGEVVSVSEGAQEEDFADKTLKRATVASYNATMPVEPGSVEVTATVTVTFALKPR
jgi:uncharacterized protein